MEPNLRQSDNIASPTPVEHQVPLPNGQSLPPLPRRGNVKGGSSFRGIHQRREKRFPFSTRITPDMLVPVVAAPLTPPLSSDPLTPWKEAVMLWLSWNSTYEKVTAKMCKPGHDQNKIEALMDEMDKLRGRAIELSERLFS
jgi:hypothetical protein